MYSVKSSKLKDIIEGSDPSQAYSSPYWQIWIEETGGDPEIILTGSSVSEVTIDGQTTTGSEDIEIGAVCSRTAEIKVLSSDTENKTDFLGRKFRICLFACDKSYPKATYADLHSFTYSQLARLTAEQIKDLGCVIEGELIPLAEMTCVKSKKTGMTSELTFADRLYFADSEFIWTFGEKTSAAFVEAYICARLGMENGNSYSGGKVLADADGKILLDSNGKLLISRDSTLRFTVTKPPEGTTMRQMLGYIASAQGQFGMIDRFGRYVRKWYGDISGELTDRAIDEPQLSEQDNVITGIICKVNDSLTLTKGDTSGNTGRVAELENPYMTAELMEMLFRRLSAMRWSTAEITNRPADPRTDLGDVLACRGRTVLVTGQTISFSSGLRSDIRSVGRSAEEILI